MPDMPGIITSEKTTFMTLPLIYVIISFGIDEYTKTSGGES
jgi:hypothetical protein